MVVPLHGGLKRGTQPSELLRLAQRVRKSAKPKEGAGRDCDGNGLDPKAPENLEQTQSLRVCEQVCTQLAHAAYFTIVSREASP